MIKKIGMVLLSTWLTSSLYAADITESQKFIGVEVSITEVQGDGPSDIANNVSNGTSIGIRIGAMNDEWRTTVGLNYFDAEGRNVEKLYGSIDYFFLKTEVSESLVFKPFLGFTVGYANYESNEVDSDGFIYGGQAGILMDVFDNVSVDVGYRYTLSNSSEFDHSGDVVFGLNYQY
jgi:opacity protein-like surface antigen